MCVCGHWEDSALCAPVEECRLAAQCVARSLPNNPVRFWDFGLVVCETCTSLTPNPHMLSSLLSHSLYFAPLPLLQDTPLEFRSKQPQPKRKKKKNPVSLSGHLELLFCKNMHEYAMVGWEAVCSTCWLRSQRERETGRGLSEQQSCNNPSSQCFAFQGGNSPKSLWIEVKFTV